MKIKKLVYFILSILIIGFLISCDDVSNPLKERAEGKCGDENSPTPIRKILVEDYTGHTCGNCPRAAEAMEELKNTYCDHIVSLSVHVGLFAEPEEHYTEDFRSEAGNGLDDFFAVSNKGLPNGMVNRTILDGNTVIAYSDWATAVEAVLTNTPEINLKISNSYDETNRKVKVKVDTEFLKDANKKLNLCVYFVEDSIIAPQKDYSLNPASVEDYVHRHVLRASLNGTWGEEILSNSAKFGDVITKEYNYEIPGEYNVEHCEIVSFVYLSDTKEVVQADSEKVK